MAPRPGGPAPPRPSGSRARRRLDAEAERRGRCRHGRRTATRRPAGIRTRHRDRPLAANLSRGASVACAGHADPPPARRDRGRRRHRRGGDRRRHRAAGGPAWSRPTRSTAAELPPFDAISQRSVVYDAVGNVIDIFQAREPEPGQLAPGPAGRHRRRAGRRGRELLPRTRASTLKSLLRAMLANVSAGEVRQGGSTITQQLVKLSFLDVPPGRRPQDPRGVLRGRAREEVHEGPDPRALPQHRLLRQQRLRPAGRGRDVLRQERRPARRWPRARSSPASSATRPATTRSATPSGRGPAAGQALDRLVATGHMTAGAGHRRQRRLPLPAAPQRALSTGKATSYFADAGEGAAAQQDDHPRRRPAGALQRALPRRPEDLHDARPGAAGGGRAGPGARRCPTPDGRFDAAIVSLDTKTGAVRAMVGGPGFDQLQVNLALQPRQTGSSVEVHHPGRGHRGRRPAQRPDRRHRALHAAEPGRPEAPVRHHRRRQRRRRTRSTA